MNRSIVFVPVCSFVFCSLYVFLCSAHPRVCVLFLCSRSENTLVRGVVCFVFLCNTHSCACFVLHWCFQRLNSEREREREREREGGRERERE